MFGLYRDIVDNARRINDAQRCLKDNNMPNVELLSLEGDYEFGQIKLWEEESTREGYPIVSTYMQLFIFPPQEVMKEELLQAGKEQRMPGPDKRKTEGPSAREVAEIKSNNQGYDIIKDISEDFGGKAIFQVDIVDDGESFYSLGFQIDHEIIARASHISLVDEEADVYVEVDLDFFYDIVSAAESHPELEFPEWEKRPLNDVVKTSVSAVKIGSTITSGIATGKIKVKPITAIPKVMKIVKLMASKS